MSTDWFRAEEMSTEPIRRTQSSRSDYAKRTCFACKEEVSVEIPWLESKSWPEDPWQFGLDGRPSYEGADLGRDVRLLEEQQLRLETCPRCDHVAPRLDTKFMHVEEARARRAALASVGEYGRTALRYIYLSALYGDTYPHRQGLWLLRAAWAAEAMGLDAYGRNLRRFAGTLFEETLAGGVALATYRGGTSLELCEIHRVGGDFDLAAQHCRRGIVAVLANRKAHGDLMPNYLLAEADRILSRRQDVLRRQMVKDEWPTTKPRRDEILAAIEALCPAPPPIRQSERSHYHESENTIAFARDYVDADRLLHHLKTSHGTWSALCVRPHLLAPLLLAADHADPDIRKSVIDVLYDRRLPFPPSVLEGRTDAIDALARRLFDDDAMVCRAGPVLEQVLSLAPEFRTRVTAAAQSALDARKHDLSAEGVLERFGARVRP